MPKTTLLERIDFLARELELSVPDVLAQALETGVHCLYRQQMGEKYLAGALSREKALHLLGPQEVARLECLLSRRCDLAEEEIELICGHA